MPARQTRKERDKEDANRREEAAMRRARQADRGGLSPARGWGGTPFYPEKPGHHWENVQFGQREYRDIELIHMDYSRPQGSQAFLCRLHPASQPTPGPEPSHRDPMLGQASGQQTQAESSPVQHCHVDLTCSPSPPPPPAQQPEPTLAEMERNKPMRAKLGFHVYIPNPLTPADKRSGTPQTYIDYNTTKEPFDILVQVHGVPLQSLKDALFQLCDQHKKACGRLLKLADQHGQVILKGYVSNGGVFGKSLMPVIANETNFNDFKRMVIDKTGKEIGFRILMENPKKVARTTSKETQFDQALVHVDPDALDSARHDELEMDTIGVASTFQAIRTQLMVKYGHASIGGKECMGCVNPGNPTQAMHLSHASMDIWAKAIVAKVPGVSIMKPPHGPEFVWLPISNSQGRSQPFWPAPPAQSTSQPPPYTNNTSNTSVPITNTRSDSPAPRPLPPFERFLEFASIDPNDQRTRDALILNDLVNFEMFLSHHLSIEKLESLGFAFGPALRLHENAPLYRDHLKNPTF